MRRREHQSGFGTTVILLVVLVVAVLAVSGLVVYQRHKSSNAKNNAATGTTQTTTQPQTTTTQTTQTTTLATHTSTLGGFSFQYPSDYKVTEGQAGTGDEISISSTTNNPVVNGKASPNVFSMTFYISSSPSSPFSPARLQKGTIQTASNGIPIWTSTEASSTIPTNPTGLTVCPEFLITSADKTNFNYALPNGKYLTLEAGYCEGQGANTLLTYQQQLASADWQAGTAIIQSIKFQ